MREGNTIKVEPDVFAALANAIDVGRGKAEASEDGDDILVGQLALVCSREPHNIEAEAALLGALMIDNRLVDEVTRLRPAHFYEPLHADIYGAILERVGAGTVANPVTLRPRFEEHELMAQIGGAGYLAQLTGSGAALIGARDFADQIIDLAELRALREGLRNALRRSNGAEETPALTIVADLEADMSDVLTEAGPKTTVTFAQAFTDTVREVEAIGAGGDPAGFLIARYHDWNAVVGRMEPQDLILLGARPSMGKTGVGVTVALGGAENGIGTDFLSLEMDRRKATRRAIAQLIHDPDDPLPYQDLIDGKLRKVHWRAIVNAQVELEKLPLSISDPTTMYIEDLAPHIRKRQREFERRGWPKLQLVIADYLGRFQTRKKLQGETEIASYISRMAKQAAKETDVALVCLSQLSRAVEQRENKRPMLQDLRQSGSLEQDADTVVFLYREEYYLRQAGEPSRDKVAKHAEWLESLARCIDEMEIYSSKRREGALSKRTSKFFTKYQAVLDHDDRRLNYAPSFFDQADYPDMRG